MAAVTVEDCLKIIPNRFKLSLVASYRSKQLMNGAPALYVSEKIEKNTVVALREISANLLNIQNIEEEIKNNLKNQALFKNFDENLNYDLKKDSDLLLNSNLVEEIDEEEIEEEVVEDDEEYYNNLDSVDTKDLSDEDSDK